LAKEQTMAANKRFNFGPVALTNTYTTNILNPPTATGGVGAGSSANYIVLNWIRVVNKGASAATFRLYKGATGSNTAGTEVAYDISVAAGSSLDMYPNLRLDAADFLVGGASASTTLVILGGGEIGVA
jgi:hypothetical protein